MSKTKGKLWYGWYRRDERVSRTAGCRVRIKVTFVIPPFLTPDGVNGRSVDRMRYKRFNKDLRQRLETLQRTSKSRSSFHEFRRVFGEASWWDQHWRTRLRIRPCFGDILICKYGTVTRKWIVLDGGGCRCVKRGRLAKLSGRVGCYGSTWSRCLGGGYVSWWFRKRKAEVRFVGRSASAGRGCPAVCERREVD